LIPVLRACMRLFWTVCDWCCRPSFCIVCNYMTFSSFILRHWRLQHKKKLPINSFTSFSSGNPNYSFLRSRFLGCDATSDEHVKHLYLGLSFTFFFFVLHYGSLRTPPIFSDVRRETKARNPWRVCTAGLFTRKLTSFTLCYYVIGLFNRAQTNHKPPQTQKEKNV